MLISEAIKKMQSHLKEFGDLELHIVNEDGFHFQTIERIEVLDDSNIQSVCIEIGQY